MSGLGTCRDCNAWIYWGEYQAVDGSTKNVPYDEPGYFTMHWQTCEAQDWIRDPIGTMYTVTHCNRCGHTIYFETTRRGRQRPMDCYYDEDTGGWSTDNITHFETCPAPRPNTNNWRGEQAHRERVRAEAAGTQSHTGLTTETLRKIRMWVPDLGLTWPTTRDEITSQFRKLALTHHPDMGGQAQDFIKVKRAYDALKDLVPA